MRTIAAAFMRGRSAIAIQKFIQMARSTRIQPVNNHRKRVEIAHDVSHPLLPSAQW
jgi:hypothetical protein